VTTGSGGHDPDAPARVAHFRILATLGQGGMGVVYRAEDEKLRRPVAIKLLQDTSGNEERRQRFLREARSAASITHPNVAVVHAVDEADGRIYIAMELVEGENLRDRMDRARLDLATAKDLAGQIARGLAAAHEKGIVHRDLKPENVMITPSGVVKLLDFGLAKSGVAKAESGKTEAELAKTETLVTSDEGRVMGTPGYMSPEQAAGEALDVRSDVFSFGIVLYEMLSGARPFEGESTAAVLAAILRDEPAPLRATAPAVDDATAAIVTRCLAKKPGERFASAEEIVAALRASAGQSSPKATTASRAELEPITRSGVAPKRSRAGVVALGVVMAAVVFGLVRLWTVGWWTMGASRPQGVAAATVGAAASGSAITHRGKAITDCPPPKTSVPEAAAAYAGALQSLRGASLAHADDELERATRLDPTLAPAQLRAALNFDKITSGRLHLAAAEQFRSALDGRGQMLLKVAEAMLADPMNAGEVLQRARAVTQLFPDDAEASCLLGSVLLDQNQTGEGRAELQRALDLDPEFAQALAELGQNYWYADSDAARALAALGGCLEVSPSASTCVRARAAIYQEQGQCAKFEADARAATALDPNGRRAHQVLAMALAAQNAPREAVEEALRKAASLAPDADTKARMTVENALDLALLEGDLGAAEAAARRAMALAEGAQTAAEHYDPLIDLFEVLEERGDEPRALAEVEAFDRQASAWSSNAPCEVMDLAFMRYQAHRIDRASLDGTLSALRPRVKQLNLGELWWPAHMADNPLAPDQATGLLAEYGDAGVLVRPGGDAPRVRGRILLAAGDAADAVASLRLAAQSCSILTDGLYHNTIRWMHTQVQLGQALGQAGDKAGACSAYAVVVDRWKNAKPRSVTLEKAKERSRALGCKP